MKYFDSMPQPSRRLPRSRKALSSMLEKALTLHRQGTLSQAADLYETVLSFDENNFDVLYNLAIIRLNTNLDSAVALLQRALKIRPNSSSVESALGSALALKKQYRIAILHFEKALQLDPTSAATYNNLGIALQSVGRHASAIASFKSAIDLVPDLGEAYHNLGKSLRALGQHQKAIDCFRKAITFRPKLADARADLGISLQSIGRIREGSDAIRSAIDLAPLKTSFYRILSESDRLERHDPYLTKMEALAARIATLTEEQQVHLHFGLARAYQGLGLYHQSFEQYARGNQLMRKRIGGNKLAKSRYFKPVLSRLSRQEIYEMGEFSSKSIIPIFIVGMPRSGSTLIEQIIASHPEASSMGESCEFIQIVRDKLGCGSNEGPELNSITGRDLSELANDYIRVLEARFPQAGRVVDKQLLNFRYLGLIYLAFPKAHIIHVKRNPIDTCYSCFTTLFASGHEYSYDLNDLGTAYCSYSEVMGLWRSIIPQDVMLEVQYEDVVSDFETHARRIIAHCGLNWHKACLEFNKSQNPIYNASSYQVRQPLYESSVGRWRNQKEHLIPLLNALERVLHETR